MWSDWSAIEARVTPWLAASPEADEVLEVFRASDADPDAARQLHGRRRRHPAQRPERDNKGGARDRQGGDPRAWLRRLGRRAAGDGAELPDRLDDAEARRIVDAWREANPWARDFWGAHRDGESFGLWGAALTAWEQPGRITTAGRLGFAYRDDYLGGSLFMALPSGRLLTYPRPKWRDVDVLDKDGKPTGETRRELSFQRAHGRAKLWHGTLCENAVQATAADVLRETVTRIETEPGARLHADPHCTPTTRSSVEVDEARADEAKAILRARDADPAGLGRGPAAAVGRKRLPLLHQSEGGALDTERAHRLPPRHAGQRLHAALERRQAVNREGLADGSA